MTNPSPKAPPQSACFLALMESSKKANPSIIESLFKTETFSQEQLDDAFRNCIQNYTKKKHDSFKKCINLFLTKIEDINYQNPKYNNTTILMYSFEYGQILPIDLILNNEYLDITITDNKGENCLFKLIKNKDMNEQSQIDFLERLISLKIDPSIRNNKGENIMDIMNNYIERNVLKKMVNNYIQNTKFDIMKYIEMYNKEEYEEVVSVIEKYRSKERYEGKGFRNLKLEYNKMFMEMKMVNNNNHNDKGDHVNREIFTNEMLDCFWNIINFLKNDINIHSHLPHIQILLLNKLFMLYQLGNFIQFKQLKHKIELSNNNEFLQDKMFYIYIQCIYIDFLYERHLLNEAKEQLNLLQTHFPNKLSFLEFQTNSTLNIYNNFFIKSNLFNITNESDFTKLIQLYNISFMIYDTIPNKKEHIEGNIPLTKPHIKQALNSINQLGIDESNTSSIVFSFFVYLQIHLIYYSSHFSLNKINIKLEKLLNSIMSNTQNIQSEIKLIFYYNTNGILNLKNNNYVLASFYFLRCINIIKHKTSFYLIKLNHYYPQIAFNLALSYFFQKKYSQCINILSSLLSDTNSLLLYRKYVYYRLALAQLELHIQQTKNERDKYIMLYNKQIENEMKGISNEIKGNDMKMVIPVPQCIKRNFEKCLSLIKNCKGEQIYVNTVINIVYCCIRNREYTEALFYLNNKLKGIYLTGQQNNVVNTYRLQVVFYMRNIYRNMKMEKEWEK